MRLPAALLGAALVVAAGGCGRSLGTDRTTRSASGAIIEPGDLGTTHLRVGDCIRDAVPAEVGALYGIPCARPHLAQVFALVDDTEGCFDAVDHGIRGLSDRTDLPQIDVSALIAGGDDSVVCILEFAEPIVEDLVRPSA